MPAGAGWRLRRRLAVAGVSAAIIAALFAAIAGEMAYHDLSARGLFIAGTCLAGVIVMVCTVLVLRQARHAISGDTIMIAEGERARSALRRQRRWGWTVALLTVVASAMIASVTTDASLVFFGVMCAIMHLQASSVARRMERRIAYRLAPAGRTSLDTIRWSASRSIPRLSPDSDGPISGHGGEIRDKPRH